MKRVLNTAALIISVISLAIAVDNDYRIRKFTNGPKTLSTATSRDTIPVRIIQYRDEIGNEWKSLEKQGIIIKP